MSLRLRGRWKQEGRERSLEDLATAAASNAWRAACNGVLNLENEGFETASRAQRLDIIEEFVAFLVLVADRQVYDRLDDDERGRFITAMALRLSELVDENRSDAQGPGPYREQFIDKLNERTGHYAECSYSEQEGPGFSMLCVLGDRVTEVLGPTNRKWAQDQVVAIDGPEAAQTFRRALKSLLGAAASASRSDEGPRRPLADD
ncbi:hypothetical protein [Thioalkalivibrio paradoxus]|uniref:Uncharacterized protein n=1 Tax=Thioalkalivibrio paradoxus ARh 1 TaxID=713585 RepID=W0DPB6_9GAMM|nr:hypothetical protein [Thioalkalivibrio paradoxus]AHE98843.1 hypothetical protein THITH_11945 [Thioalkalivibrio paradoxus ARh 1]